MRNEVARAMDLGVLQAGGGGWADVKWCLSALGFVERGRLAVRRVNITGPEPQRRGRIWRHLAGGGCIGAGAAYQERLRRMEPELERRRPATEERFQDVPWQGPEPFRCPGCCQIYRSSGFLVAEARLLIRVLVRGCMFGLPAGRVVPACGDGLAVPGGGAWLLCGAEREGSFAD